MSTLDLPQRTVRHIYTVYHEEGYNVKHWKGASSAQMWVHSNILKAAVNTVITLILIYTRNTIWIADWAGGTEWSSPWPSTILSVTVE